MPEVTPEEALTAEAPVGAAPDLLTVFAEWWLAEGCTKNPAEMRVAVGQKLAELTTLPRKRNVHPGNTA